MGLLELCEQVFGTADLYRVLGVRREASDGEVRRGYHKVSLQVHPDRVDEDQKEDATRRFQVCGPAFGRPPELLPLRGTPFPVQLIPGLEFLSISGRTVSAGGSG